MTDIWREKEPRIKLYFTVYLIFIKKVHQCRCDFAMKLSINTDMELPQLNFIHRAVIFSSTLKIVSLPFKILEIMVDKRDYVDKLELNWLIIKALICISYNSAGLGWEKLIAGLQFTQHARAKPKAGYVSINIFVTCFGCEWMWYEPHLRDSFQATE